MALHHPRSCYRHWQVFLLSLLALASAQSQVPAAVSEAGSEEAQARIRFGKELFSSKAACRFCHGWAGDGRGEAHSPGGAADLRRSRLTREGLLNVIACGRPGTSMPHFDAYAYDDGHCYGLRSNRDSSVIPPNPPHPLQPGEISAIVDYLLQDVLGKGSPTRAQCVEFFADAAPCGSYP